MVEIMEWYTKELAQLNASPLVNMRIHSTRLPPVSTTYNSSISLEEKNKPSTRDAILSPMVSENVDIEKENTSASSSIYSSPSINQGRPDIAAIITDIVLKADRHDMIAVAACGPDDMIQVARKTVAKTISVDGPSLELHCEQFGW
jgi:Ferric reductase NAD binding domain